MISSNQLKNLKESGFDAKHHLVDIKSITVDCSQSTHHRTLQYINDVRNPYLFKVGDTVVQVKYGGANISLQNILERQHHI